MVLFFHCVRLLFCPAGARPLGACSPPLASWRGSSGPNPAVRPVPGPLGVRTPLRHRHPTPGPHAGDPVASGDMAARTRRADLLRPPKRHCLLVPSTTTANGGWRGDPPRGPQERLRRSVRDPSGRLAVGCRWRGFIRTARGPAAGRPCSVARAGGSEGWARGPARATAHGPWGKSKASRSEKETSLTRPVKRPHGSGNVSRWRAGADLARDSVHGVDWQANCFGSAPAGTSRAGRARASRAPGLPLRTRR